MSNNAELVSIPQLLLLENTLKREVSYTETRLREYIAEREEHLDYTVRKWVPNLRAATLDSLKAMNWQAPDLTADYLNKAATQGYRFFGLFKTWKYHTLVGDIRLALRRHLDTHESALPSLWRFSNQVRAATDRKADLEASIQTVQAAVKALGDAFTHSSVRKARADAEAAVAAAKQALQQMFLIGQLEHQKQYIGKASNSPHGSRWSTDIVTLGSADSDFWDGFFLGEIFDSIGDLFSTAGDSSSSSFELFD